MIFKELISILKKVKTEKDLTEEVSAELTSAAVFAQMNSLIQEHDAEPEEAFEITRTIILKHLDMILMDMVTDPFEGLEDDDIDNMPSPMDDPILNASIQKAMEEYNDRLDKKNPPSLKKV